MSRQDRAYLVIRRPVLMEDEGRSQAVRVFKTEQAAVAWMAAQVDYFKPSDYYYVEIDVDAKN